MTDLRSLTTVELLHSTDKAVSAEKDAITNTTRHFLEVFARRAFLPKYPSMFEFLRKKYGYCNASAQMRIDAIKLMADLPDVRERIESGELTMSAAANIQSFIVAENRNERPLSIAAKNELISNSLGKSKLEVQKEIVKLKTQELVQDQPVSVMLTAKAHKNLKALLNALSDVDPNMSMSQLIELLSEDGLEKYERHDRDTDLEQQIAAKRSRHAKIVRHPHSVAR